MQKRPLSVDPLAMCGITAADDLIDKGTVGSEIVKVIGAAHQQRIADRIFEMAMRTLNRAVLMGDALVVAGWRHLIMGESHLVCRRADN